MGMRRMLVALIAEGHVCVTYRFQLGQDDRGYSLPVHGSDGDDISGTGETDVGNPSHLQAPAQQISHQRSHDGS